MPAEQQTQQNERAEPAQQRSLYRRHRPRTFADVVGQEPVVRTLSNAIARDKVHHAYLFVGSRGTGKTSMAKILAACVNCERAPTIDPCGECESCVSIANASSLDVIEMDAASNNSVDDIRELRESVAYAPVSGRRKVYILDEAHMLSTAAWNAFLKTLEEPPPNTVFVLATTEANKVPATVVDRCHRFDFHRPTVEQIASVIARVATVESIDIPPEAVSALARSATGSFRDALGTLEQLVTYSGTQVVLEDVLAVLGVADARLLEETVDAIAAGDAKGALLALERCAQQGRDAASFASDLESRARELMVVQTLGEVPAQLALTPEADAALAAQAQRVSHETVVRTLELLAQALEAVRAGADARTRLELALVKAAKPEVDGSLQGLLARIERLEHRGRAGGPNGTDDPETGAGDPAGERAGTDAAPAPTEDVPTLGVVAEAPAEEVQIPGAVAEAPAEEVQIPGAVAEIPAEEVQIPGAVAEIPAEEVQIPGAVPPTPADDVQTSGTDARRADLETLCSLWPTVVEMARERDSLLWASIDSARPVSVDGEKLTLAYPFDAEFHKKKAEDSDRRAVLVDVLGTVVGGRWHVAYELRESPSTEDGPEDEQQSEQERVRRFMEAFDAEDVTGERSEV